MLSEQQIQDFCEELKTSGSIPKSAALIGASLAEVKEARNKSTVFDQMVLEAQEYAADSLEVEARRRSVNGVRKPVFYQGEAVGEVIEYSDNLLKELLKANKPEKFRERYDIGVTGDIQISIAGWPKGENKSSS